MNDNLISKHEEKENIYYDNIHGRMKRKELFFKFMDKYLDDIIPLLVLQNLIISELKAFIEYNDKLIKLDLYLTIDEIKKHLNDNKTVVVYSPIHIGDEIKYISCVI